MGMTAIEKILARNSDQDVVTPGTQAIYLEALRRGYIETLMAAGAVCITDSTRNFKGRMGDPGAKIYMGSPATVAASAIRGAIADPREYVT